MNSKVVYVVPNFRTISVLALGPHFRPLLALGCLCPHFGTMPIWGAQCWNRTFHLENESLIVKLYTTLTWHQVHLDDTCQYGDANIPVPTPYLAVPALGWCQNGVQHIHYRVGYISYFKKFLPMENQ